LGYHILCSIYTRDMMDCVVTASEVDLGLPHSYSIYTRDMMDCVVTSSEVDLGLPHSLQYLY
jgi:predicted MarR family transcription regulator